MVRFCSVLQSLGKFCLGFIEAELHTQKSEIRSREVFKFSGKDGVLSTLSFRTLLYILNYCYSIFFINIL